MSNFGANSTFGDKSNSGVNSLDSSNQFGRVYNVLLTDDEKDASVMKVPPGSIGAIQFKFLVKGIEDNSPITQTAYPLDPRSRSFPVKNEVVEIISGPSNRVQDAESNNSQVYYYKSVVDMWGSAEHNARPNSRFDTDKSQVTGEFVEKGDISRMKHLPGDYVIEGRFGNGVRFGSSSSKTKVSSPWSGPDGSPLVIVSNGRRKGKLSFEDINKDGSSMYMLSDQNLSFEPASLNFESYNVTMTAVQSAQVVKLDPVKAAEPVSVQAVPATEPPTLTIVADVPTKKEELKVDEVEALPEKEEPRDFQEYESLVVGTVKSSNGMSYIKDYVIDDKTFKSNGVERLVGTSPKNAHKGKFRNLAFVDFTRTPYTVELFAKSLTAYIEKGLLAKNLARSILAVAINEQGGTDGFNNNFWGIHSDIGSFSRTNTFSSSNPSYQVLAREGSTRSMRAYLGFSTLDDAIRYISDVLKYKGFDNLTYGGEEENNFTRLYINSWWSPVDKNVSTMIFNLKKQGYIKAKKLIP